MRVVDLYAETADAMTSAARGPCDVCIIGTGPAGATIAAELADGPLRVTILESGSFARRDDADRLNDIENVGRARVADQYGVRNRVVGGSSHTWAGRVAPFDEIDYESRPWVTMSGWPIDHDDLAPYLSRSARYLGLALGEDFSDERFWELARSAKLDILPNPALLRPFYWQFAHDPRETWSFEPMRFGRHLVDGLGPRQTLVTGATVLRVEPTRDGAAVRAVHFAAPDGTVHELEAATVVLATGGIENARLLLASASNDPRILGDGHDHVGRYLMDHLRGRVATFDVSQARPLQRKLIKHTARGALFSAGLRLSPDVQRSERLLNASAWVNETWAEDDPWRASRNLVRGMGSRRKALRSLVANAGYLVRGMPDYLVRHIAITHKVSDLELLAMLEQRPDPDSRMTLGESRDRFGQRLPRIDWRSHPDEAATARRIAVLAASELERMGFPAPTLEPWVVEGGPLPESWMDVAHPTGTTRMSARPEDGVVDSRGEVHGVAGLYIAGSSTFPTAGHCNPTQMIVALAIRTADAIGSRPMRHAVTADSLDDAVGGVEANADPDVDVRMAPGDAS